MLPGISCILTHEVVCAGPQQNVIKLNFYSNVDGAITEGESLKSVVLAAG